MTLSLLMALLATPVFAECPASAGDLDGRVDFAMEAYQAWDWVVFQEQMDMVDESLSCMAEVIPSAVAAKVHLVAALRDARDRDKDSTVRAFRGLLAIQPSYTPSQDMAAEGSFLHTAWLTAAAPHTEQSQALPAGTWFLDGATNATRLPLDRNAVLQRMSQQDGLLSWYIVSDDPPPEVTAQPTALDTPPPRHLTHDTPFRDSPGHTSRWLAAGAAGCALAFGGSYALSRRAEGVFWDATQVDDAEAAYRHANTFAVIGYSTGASSVGLVAAAVLVGSW